MNNKLSFRFTLSLIIIAFLSGLLCCNRIDVLDAFLYSGPPPSVDSITPRDGESNVEPDTDIIITFSKGMDRESVESAFSLMPGDIGGTFSWNDEISKATFTTANDLQKGIAYTITLTTDATDYVGTSIETIFTSGFISRNLCSIETKIAASDGESGGSFGISVSISDDYAIVGADGDENGTGAAYIFTSNTAEWIEQAKLTASDGVEGDYFGSSISIYDDYAIVGAYGDESFAGAAYLFKRDGIIWTEQQKLTESSYVYSWEQYGYSVDITGNYAIIGAYNEMDSVDAGAAFIYELEGGIWIEYTKLLESDRELGDYFGYSVGISGDYAIIGVPYDDENGNDAGSAIIYYRDNGTWTEQAKLKASDGEVADSFGYSVDISGSYIIVGVPYDDDNGSASGSAYIFTRTGTIWTEQAKLTASDAVENDQFGFSASISGKNVIVGAPYNSNNGSASGSAYIFTCTGSTWIEKNKITASDNTEGDNFGYSVSISGETAIVGAHGDDDNGSGSGSAYIFE